MSLCIELNQAMFRKPAIDVGAIDVLAPPFYPSFWVFFALFIGSKQIPKRPVRCKVQLTVTYWSFTITVQKRKNHIQIGFSSIFYEKGGALV